MIQYKSLVNSFALAEVSTMWITKNKDVLSANNFAFDKKLSARSLRKNKKRRGLKTGPWGIPV